MIKLPKISKKYDFSDKLAQDWINIEYTSKPLEPHSKKSER